MSTSGLTAEQLAQLDAVFARHPDVERVVLFGSRAKGIARLNSDIDVAVYGPSDALQIESIALDLDELPLPYKIDVVAVATIQNNSLREHIERVGIVIYERGEPSASTIALALR